MREKEESEGGVGNQNSLYHTARIVCGVRLRKNAGSVFTDGALTKRVLPSVTTDLPAIIVRETMLVNGLSDGGSPSIGSVTCPAAARSVSVIAA